jgi:hypothetical protein
MHQTVKWMFHSKSSKSGMKRNGKLLHMMRECEIWFMNELAKDMLANE